jgi:hypothetical protein
MGQISGSYLRWALFLPAGALAAAIAYFLGFLAPQVVIGGWVMENPLLMPLLIWAVYTGCGFVFGRVAVAVAPVRRFVPWVVVTAWVAGTGWLIVSQLFRIPTGRGQVVVSVMLILLFLWGCGAAIAGAWALDERA